MMVSVLRISAIWAFALMIQQNAAVSEKSSHPADGTHAKDASKT